MVHRHLRDLVNRNPPPINLDEAGLDYHTGKLAEAVATGVIAHISSCPTCQATLKTFGDSAASLMARLRRAKPEDPYAHEPQRQQMLDRVKALAETIVRRESPPRARRYGAGRPGEPWRSD